VPDKPDGWLPSGLTARGPTTGFVAPQRSDTVSRANVADDITAARRFLQRLAGLPEAFRRPALPPLLDVDPYLSAWTNVESALGNAPAPERARSLAVAAELDGEIRAMDLTPGMKEAARRAVRALLARRWLLTPESFKFVYEPFETLIPVDSL
jgi:hypothetical protein